MESKGIAVLAVFCLAASAATATPLGSVCWNSKAKAASPVNVTLYYEALCPGCHQFILTTLTDSLKTLGSIMTVSLLPYGNAQETKQGDKYVFTCQHGKSECEYNILESCAIHYQPQFSDHFPFILCTEQDVFVENDWDKTLTKCASKISTPKETLSACVTGPLGNALEHEMAVRTGDHEYVPWVIVDGVQCDLESKQFNQCVCDAYKGTKPPACN